LKNQMSVTLARGTGGGLHELSRKQTLKSSCVWSLFTWLPQKGDYSTTLWRVSRSVTTRAHTKLADPPMKLTTFSIRGWPNP